MLELQGDGGLSALRERQFAVTAGIGTRTDAMPCLPMVATLQRLSRQGNPESIPDGVLRSPRTVCALDFARRSRSSK